jgi:hypothetical protein
MKETLDDQSRVELVKYVAKSFLKKRFGFFCLFTRIDVIL